ncbi:MAG: hypothetical protein M1827_004393 [Pycnora praestabilis]|nr:MAG: hypothetical protein M1827_004393 [Pycnora praestabilis]
MEGIHGVDVSWLHHSLKDPNQRTRRGSLSVPAETQPRTSSDSIGRSSIYSDAGSDSEKGAPARTANGRQHSPVPQTRRPYIGRRASSKERSTSPAPNGLPQAPRTGPTSRRNSWISNISSKFSSSNAPDSTQTITSPTSPKVPTIAVQPAAQPPGDLPVSQGKQGKGDKDGQTPSAPSSPKTGHPSFLQSALRRLSSSSGLPAAGKLAGSGTVCKRRIMNLDPDRERCRVHELDQNKLRRVAFCVDVEIAGGPRYVDEDDTQASKHTGKKMKEKGEGEALKHPQAVKHEKEQEGVIKISGEEVRKDEASKPDDIGEEETRDPSRKKEKKRRSEEERKERKDRKRKQAEANGMLPVEVTREDSESSPGSTPPGSSTPRSQDRPTVDPLRIYRRCCQLREAPILRRVTEQLSDPSVCAVATPGVVASLDFAGYIMSNVDLITLGDFLAVVPVRKLVMDDCELSDEGLRIILAGLLAAKSPKEAKKGEKRRKEDRNGVIEKLSLKNNNQISAEGWRHISLFMHMSKSLKAIDLSMIPFPKHRSGSLIRSKSALADASVILSEAIGERIAGPNLEELVLAECQLNTHQIGNIVDGVIKSGLKRLGLASNNINQEGLQHVCRYIQIGKSEGLDLGGNDLQDTIHILSEAFDEQNPLWALSLADCNLTPSSISELFPALVSLPSLRFIDLSHNRGLFSTQPDALGLFRKYLPQFQILKRIHLMDVDMSPEHAIALAEVLPETPSLAHLNMLENPLLSALASATDEASQEEACALYASLMAAVRVSDTIICIDIDVPSPETSEVVKALAKQVVAYCLRNMERGPIAEAFDTAAAAAAITEPHRGEKNVAVPDILLHLVGHVEGFPENHDDDEPAPDDDYVIGGTGVVKALGIVLGNKASDTRRYSRDFSPSSRASSKSRATSKSRGVSKSRTIVEESEVGDRKAKDMSKNLLGSARKIRARLQPALIREAKADEDLNYSKFSAELFSVSYTKRLPVGRLVFLDSTLERMVQRFEDEYPECRLDPAAPPPQPLAFAPNVVSRPSSFAHPSKIRNTDNQAPNSDPTSADQALTDEEDEIRPPLARHDSDVSLAGRALTMEEGRMHRFGQQVRRDILRPQLKDYVHGTTGHEYEATHLQLLRSRLELLNGSEIKERVMKEGPDAVMDEIGASAEELRILEEEDPEAFEKFRDAQLIAQYNIRGAGERSSEEAVGE